MVVSSEEMKHHITGWHHTHNSAKLPDYVKMSPEQSYSLYNLRPRAKQSVKWPNYPVNFEESEFSIDNL